MRVLIAGGSGLIGRALIESLTRDSHQALVLSRAPQQQRGLPSGVRAVGWDGETLGPWVAELAACDAVVQLSGESIFGRWTAAKKRRLHDSRLRSSRLIAEAIAAAPRRPAVLVQGSAVGYYGDTGDATVDERAPAGADFLATLARDWEAASASVEPFGVRRPVVRTAVVLSRDGGALPQVARACRLFAGGPLGSGRQWFPWIHQADEVGAIRFLLEAPAATGPFNLVAPDPARNADFVRAVAATLHRPSWLPAPAFALRLALGELGDVLLAGQRAMPERLQALGFSFRFPTLAAALADLLR